MPDPGREGQPGFRELAIDAYKQLLKGGKPSSSHQYFMVDVSSYPEFEAGKIELKLKAIRDPSAPFVGFVESENGLVFPSHRIAYTDAMNDLFADLKEFDAQRQKENAAFESTILWNGFCTCVIMVCDYGL